METPNEPKETLPSALHEHVGTVSDFYARHEEKATAGQRLFENISLILGTPAYVGANLVGAVLWMGWNLVAPGLGFDQWDEPPFFWLQGFIALNAFVISTAVLIRQNRMSSLANQHAHLDLQVNLLAEEKSSKIIGMLEELRRDLPNVRNKVDHEAEELSRPTDTEAVLSIIEESGAQLNCERK
ncbi:DUF1003 domain-containing protein [Telluria aromaticivorans]|uniref:DUF1003 domain-containing protein n=1 Tax=Telluria aromaticivorans TaxID=2725995 RepID=A0A7Y2P0K0_9BURK|nr:DUF1003 domain-containing protein [Telluria aromaticivorans]NNG25002.1 DUF1003 domain-containing protein [Telluria aromaticivorans]